MKSYFTLFLLMLGMTAQAQFSANNLAVLKISGTAIGAVFITIAFSQILNPNYFKPFI